MQAEYLYTSLSTSEFNVNICTISLFTSEFNANQQYLLTCFHVSGTVLGGRAITITKNIITTPLRHLLDFLLFCSIQMVYTVLP